MTTRSRHLLERQRAHDTATGLAIVCEVTGITLEPETGDPFVNVKPVQKTRVIELDGVITHLDPLEIFDVPYAGLMASDKFLITMPPEIGMQGVLVNTNTEIGEVSSGIQETARIKDKSSGVFFPIGKLSGATAKISLEWAELRSKNTRIALSEDEVHLQADDANMCLKSGKWDINVAGISLLESLQEMSSHIKALEDLIHPDPDGPHNHGGAKPRKIDQMAKATCPNRQESGVR